MFKIKLTAKAKRQLKKLSKEQRLLVAEINEKDQIITIMNADHRARIYN